MMETRETLRTAVLWIWSILLTALAIVLAGGPLRALRRGLGRSGFWMLGLATSLAFFLLQLPLFGIIYLSLLTLTGLFVEWEELGLSLVSSAFFSLLINILLSVAGVAIWIARFGSQWKAFLISQLNEWIKPALEMSPTVQINGSDILPYLPAIIIISWLVTLYLSVVMETRAPNSRPKTSAFKGEIDKINFPGSVIWVFIFSLLAAFGEFGVPHLQELGMNVLVICLILFFFQGLAVIYRAFSVFRIGMFWQALAMILIVVVGQVFLLVSLVGLADHWAGFRARLSKGREEMNKELQ